MDNKQRKILAVLAGGLVLGIGTAVTLAAWNDSEFASSTFTAGAFDIEGSTDGTTYAEHDTAATAAAIEFTLNPDNLSPEDVVYAPFWIRIDADTTVAATLLADSVTVAAGTPDATADLSYNVYAIDAAATCGAAAVSGAPVFATGATLGALTPGAALDLADGATGTAGAPVQLCFEVTAGAGLDQGASATATWEFVATSVDPAA